MLGEAGLYALMTCVWGSAYFFTALALPSFPPATLAFARMVLAALVLAAALRVSGVRMPRGARTYAVAAVLGLTNIALPYSMLIGAQVHLDSSVTTVLSSTTPIFVFLIAGLAFRTERITVLRAAGLALAFCGIVLLHGAPAAGDGSIAWPLLVVASSAVFAAGNVATRRFMAAEHPLVVAFLQLAFGALWLTVPLAADGFRVGPVTPVGVLALLELGIAGSALTYLLFFRFVQRIGSTATSLNTYLHPLVGVTLGVAVLGDALTSRGWLALAVTGAGVALFGAAALRDGGLLRVRRTGGRWRPRGAGGVPPAFSPACRPSTR
ncbi:multidrug transporter [Agromyces rhizosphaerae]|uniref:Multidrug transporter n=2 Tax=Agromyces rhizosphaerae TaxID=88374 RepID=A0A9W6CSC2_9MICO|nr:multidrug transporter [Agromyces rhizosphaerae]